MQKLTVNIDFKNKSSHKNLPTRKTNPKQIRDPMLILCRCNGSSRKNSLQSMHLYSKTLFELKFKDKFCCIYMHEKDNNVDLNDQTGKIRQRPVISEKGFTSFFPRAKEQV